MTERFPYDRCGACGARRDAHIPGIGNTMLSYNIVCQTFRPDNEKGEWVWKPLKAKKITKKGNHG